jgi:putative endonuclease
MSNVSRGKKGEEQTVSALKAAGMQIIVQNYRCKEGEIDIIALDGETIVFIEVKAWSCYGMEDLQYGIDIKKQKKIIKTANHFLSENRQYNMMSNRFDVVFVKNNSVTHLESAFMERVL